MKPIRVFLFFVFLLFILGFISLIFPKNGVTLFGSTTLKFPSLRTIFVSKKVSKVDISHILKKSTAYKDTVLPVQELSEEEITDSLVSTDFVNFKDVTNPKKEVSEVLENIQFPENNATLLDYFFKSLLNAKSEKIHILHFGDSQIETDHVTSYIRKQLQERFGGYGLGLMPIINLGGTSVLNKSSSKNWKRFTLFGLQDTTVKTDKYGPLLSFSRFSTNQNSPKDSLGYAWIEITKSFFPSERVRIFKNIYLYYSKSNEKIKADLYFDKKLISSDILPVSQDLNYFNLAFEKPVDHFRMVLKSKKSPDFYGISLEGDNGVIVDNIPMRGSKGLDFTRNNLEMMSQFVHLLNVKLIIMQFGNNIVTNVQNSYKYYENQFSNQLLTLKKVYPNIPIVVIGASDMALKDGEDYNSYPNIEMVVKAQKNAAFKANCVFWDLYKAMGGKNSMVSWVNNEPPLAQKDYIHFSQTGARIVGEMFYNALMKEFQRYNKGNDDEKVLE